MLHPSLRILVAGVAKACRLPALPIAVDLPRKRSSWWWPTCVHTKAMNVGVPSGQDNVPWKMKEDAERLWRS